MLAEFDLIDTYFKSYPRRRKDVALGIGDDCALLIPPEGQLLAVSTDTMVENIHFLPNTTPQALGHKALAISLSDMAAMGAIPAWVMLSLTLPEADAAWVEAFCAGFFPLCDTYDLQLIGGDTTRGPLAITTQVTGFVPAEQALCRSGAQPGDHIYIGRAMGDAALALQLLQAKKTVAPALQKFLDFPDPQVRLGLALRNIASAAIDVSDGLAADLGHILAQSQVGAEVWVEDIPLSPYLSALPQTQALNLALAGGDDYALCFTVPAAKLSLLKAALDPLSVPYACIGKIEKTPGLRLKWSDASPFILEKTGYTHFLKKPTCTTPLNSKPTRSAAFGATPSILSPSVSAAAFCLLCQARLALWLLFLFTCWL